MNEACSFRRFLFPALDIRGVTVHLGRSWTEMQAGRGYAPAVAQVLGEMTAIAAMIGGQLKTPGRVTFQLTGSGPIRRLVIDCDESLNLRGMARVDPDDAGRAILSASAADLLGDGQLAMTLDLPGQRQPFQSIVPRTGETIAQVFEHYLEQSEQQPTRILLAASETSAGGLFLQKMPAADERDADGWNRILHLAATVRPQELRDLDASTLLRRLFAEDDIRLFEPRPLAYHCPRDHDKVAAMLRALGRAEAEATLAEHGEIVVHDEICNHTYRFDAAAIDEIFDGKRRLH